MNILVAGIHGVGKTYFASQVAAKIGMLQTSASKLIKEERASTNWNDDKRVSDVDGNQLALISAVRRFNGVGTRLLLDGHFVLLNADGGMTPLEPHIFESLGLSGVLLLEADPHIIIERVQDRDSVKNSLEHMIEFIQIERMQAQKVCAMIKIKLIVLSSPSIDEFTKALNELSS